ncbi:MAG: hypothetical protein JRI55_06910, partial [Deltaproteobacteria bacterium]|nr:hypothetical protein [Deltaproteobacteria bacterium]
MNRTSLGALTAIFGGLVVLTGCEIVLDINEDYRVGELPDGGATATTTTPTGSGGASTGSGTGG